VPSITPDQKPRHSAHVNNSLKNAILRRGVLIKESIDPYFNIKHRPIQETVKKYKLSTD
jgi:hypothetical protein